MLNENHNFNLGNIKKPDFSRNTSAMARSTPISCQNLKIGSKAVSDSATSANSKVSTGVTYQKSALAKSKNINDQSKQHPQKKKKVQWEKPDNLQLQLRLRDCQKLQHHSLVPTSATIIKSPNRAIIVTTPIFSPLRLMKSNNYQYPKQTHSKFQTKDSEPPFTNSQISLSAKYAYQFYPKMAISKNMSPVLITSANNTTVVTPISCKQFLSYKQLLNGSNSNNNSNSNSNKNKNSCFKNDYSNNYIHSGKLPFKYIRNAKQQVEGYPKLQKLYKLKEQQIQKFATKPFGCRVTTENLSKTLNSWVYDYDLQFDVIMIGALTENQLIYPLLTKLPIDKLCSKPGFLFIWASTQKISELSTLLNDSRTWSKKFRRSEELVFVPVDKNSVYYPNEWSIPEEQILEEVQWHCWMCITGTVRRSTDKDLIHCNVNTDLSLENSNTGNSAVPSQIYKVVENFSSSTRRLHIIPTSTGLKKHVKIRPGWVIVSPDVILDNFDPETYKRNIDCVGTNIPFNEEIEQLRPKTPV